MIFREYNEAQEEINRLCEERDALQDKVHEKQFALAKAVLESQGIKPGDQVLAMVPHGRNRQEKPCEVGISETGRVFVRPFKKDGGLSEQKFWVEIARVPNQPEDVTYSVRKEGMV